MPYWITNRLVTKGTPQRIRNFFELIKSEQQPLDFEKIVASPEIIRHARKVFSPMRPECQEQYFIDDMHWRDFTPEEELELEALGYRSGDDWFHANWGTNKIAFWVELDETTVDLGYVVISFQTAWSPPIRIVERLRDMFPDIAFCCEWYTEDEFFYRYYPSGSTAVARSESERVGEEHTITTLYLTKAEYPEFFLETQTRKSTASAYPTATSTIEPITPDRAHLWMLAPEVELLALFCPELPEAETEAVGMERPSRRNLDKPISHNDRGDPDDIPGKQGHLNRHWRKAPAYNPLPKLAVIARGLQYSKLNTGHQTQQRHAMTIVHGRKVLLATSVLGWAFVTPSIRPSKITVRSKFVIATLQSTATSCIWGLHSRSTVDNAMPVGGQLTRKLLS